MPISDNPTGAATPGIGSLNFGVTGPTKTFVPPLQAETPPSGIVSYTLTADSGAFDVIGSSATLRAARLVTAASASYAITGSAAGLAIGYRVSVASGAFLVTGTAAALRHALVIQAASTAFTVAGSAATLQAAYRLIAGSGAYAFTGSDATLIYGTSGTFTLAANSGIYTVTGTAATLRVTHQLATSSGVFTVSGAAAGLAYGRTVGAASGTFTVTGIAAAFIRGRTIGATAGSYAMTGTAAALKAAYRLTASSGTTSIAGIAANLRRGLRLTIVQRVPTALRWINVPGGGYTTANDVPTQDLTGPVVGTGLTVDIVAGGGAGPILSAVIHTPGSGYDPDDFIEIDQEPTGFTAAVQIATTSDAIAIHGFSIASQQQRVLIAQTAATFFVITFEAMLIPSVFNRLGYFNETTTRLRTLPTSTDIDATPRTTRTRSLPTLTIKEP